MTITTTSREERSERVYCGVCGELKSDAGACPACDAASSAKFFASVEPCAYCGTFDKEIRDGEVVAVEHGRCNVCARAVSMDGPEMMPTENQ